MKQPIIQVQQLVKKYGSFEAVKGISFDVMEGEIFGLLGPNGAGKSTTLEILETLREKTAGSVRIDGLSIDTDPATIKSRIGIQLQTAGFYPGLTLLELIRLFNGLYGTNADPHELLAQVQLTDKANATVKALSGGQKQRFAIATTRINQPRIIFLDEPSTGLDPQARRSLWELIRTIQKNGTTIVLTTHYMEEAEYLCNRVAIMDQGKIIAIDTPDNLIDALLKTGFERKKELKQAGLEDVFIQLTGHGIDTNTTEPVNT